MPPSKCKNILRVSPIEEKKSRKRSYKLAQKYVWYKWCRDHGHKRECARIHQQPQGCRKGADQC